MSLSMYSLANDAAPAADVFEGPEKKLEVFFTAPTDGVGFRRFPRAAWSDVLADARCSILHSMGNDAFDAYILSESSLFVYPYKLVLKTCGTTTLLLVLPKLLTLATRAGVAFAHLHYSHFRYTFPHLQPSPHSSFSEERATVERLLAGHVGALTSAVLGADAAADDDGAAHWYALCASAPPAAIAPVAAVVRESDVLELAMEGLAPSVCAAFFAESHAPLAGRALADAMARTSGVASLVHHATVDDWAFEPCGYSMNALSGAYYYTVHVTPEQGFSYASFETNDPSFSASDKLAAVLAVFQPATCTVSLTTRAAHGAAGAADERSPTPPAALYALVAPWSTTRLSDAVTVAVGAYSLVEPAPAPPAAKVEAQARTACSAKAAAAEGLVDDLSSEKAFSSADSESTAGLDEDSATTQRGLDDALLSEASHEGEVAEEDAADAAEAANKKRPSAEMMGGAAVASKRHLVCA